MLASCTLSDAFEAPMRLQVRDFTAFDELEWLGRRSAAPPRRLQLAPFCVLLVKIGHAGMALGAA